MRAVAVVALSGTLALAGCTKNTDTQAPATQTTAAQASKVDSIANMVPEDIKSSGKLVVGVNVPYTPNEFKDPSGKIIGFDVDLMNAIAATLGLTPDYREADFDKIIPSIQGGTFNVGMSSFTDTKEREQSVDFVTYFSAGTAWARPKGSDITPDNACGRKVAAQATTTQEVDELPGRAGATLGTTDPPRHDRLRGLIQHAFMKRNLEALAEPIRDIARHTAEALRESQERFRAFMDNTPVAAWQVDADSRIVLANPAYGRRPGRTGQPFLKEIRFVDVSAASDVVNEFRAERLHLLGRARSFPLDALCNEVPPAASVSEYRIEPAAERTIRSNSQPST